jgi:hypothetical protein
MRPTGKKSWEAPCGESLPHQAPPRRTTGDERVVAEAHVEREVLHRRLHGLAASVSLLARALDPTPPLPWLAGEWPHVHVAVEHADIGAEGMADAPRRAALVMED